MGEGREGPEFWRRPGLQWILKGIPGQPLLAQPDLSEQVGSRVPVAEREPERFWLKLWLEFMVPSVSGAGLGSGPLPGTTKLSRPRLPQMALCPLLWEFPLLTAVPTRSYHCATRVSSWSIPKRPRAFTHGLLFRVTSIYQVAFPFQC